MSENNILNFQTNDVNQLKNIYVMMKKCMFPFSRLCKIIINEYIVSNNTKHLIDHRITCGDTLHMYSIHFNQNILLEKDDMIYIKLFPDLGSTYNYLFSEIDRVNNWLVDITVYTDMSDSNIIFIE